MIKLEISTHSGSVDVVTVEEYSPEELNNQINGGEVQTILIGSNIYSRIEIKAIKPIK